MNENVLKDSIEYKMKKIDRLKANIENQKNIKKMLNFLIKSLMEMKNEIKLKKQKNEDIIKK